MRPQRALEGPGPGATTTVTTTKRPAGHYFEGRARHDDPRHTTCILCEVPKIHWSYSHIHGVYTNVWADSRKKRSVFLQICRFEPNEGLRSSFFVRVGEWVSQSVLVWRVGDLRLETRGGLREPYVRRRVATITTIRRNST